MQFVVQSRGSAKKPLAYPYVVLVHDNWDDYGYKSSFDASLHLSADHVIHLGVIKIVRADQKGGSTKMPKGSFRRLGKEYCSLGQKMTYYEELRRRGKSVYLPLLTGLRDAAYDDDIRAQFEDFDGFTVSLIRFASDIVEQARGLFQGMQKPIRSVEKGFKAKFKTKVAPDSNVFNIEFDFRQRGALPNRFNVLIGYNGTGKTRLLSNLAIVASGYGYVKRQDALDKAAGRFIDPQPPFKGVVVVSYSAFDTFVIPGRTEVERQRLAKEGGIFGYVYCGLREKADASSRKRDQVYRLKTPEEIDGEFLSALNRVKEGGRRHVLHEILGPIVLDPSFQRIGLNPLYSESAESDVERLFGQLSSGHKVVVKILTELTAHMAGDEPTLVLIDEPETHLHPPLLAAFLKSIRICLERFNGYAVIATHSPVVLQETPARFVHILRRVADSSAIAAPSIETFGESIGVITQEVFNLDDGATDWHETLRVLAAERGLGDIEAMLGHELGFAARSYVLSVRDEIGE